MSVQILWSYGKFVENRETSERWPVFLRPMTGDLFFNLARRPLFHEIAHHLQEGLSLGAQRAVTGMNEVEASVQRLGVDQLDGAQVAAADFGRDGHER